jgi:phage shock protein PspC (stress-responsive transcriptional regulator)
MTAASTRKLERLPVQGKIAGVCAGIAAYLDTDVTLVRAVVILLSIVPGALVGGLLAYVAAWLLMPVSLVAAIPTPGTRVVRPREDRKVAGVCAGLSRYFEVDVTVVRLIWVVLSIYPGAIVLGVIAYLIAWFIIPAELHAPMQPVPQAL